MISRTPSPSALSAASSLHFSFCDESETETIFYQKRIVDITDELAQYEAFDEAAKKCIQNQKLYPMQAEKVISFVAVKFGKEAAFWTFDKLKNVFEEKTWWDSRTVIYPLSQIQTLKTFCSFGDVDLVFRVLKEMRFYEESSEDLTRSAYEDIGLDEIHVQHGNKREYREVVSDHGFLVKPIVLLGNSFGLDAAKRALQELRNHICIKDERIQRSVAAYFRSEFGEEAKDWALSQVSYRVKFADICVVS